MTKATDSPKVKLVPSHDRALDFTYSLREWLRGVLPQVRFVMSDDLEVPDRLRFAIFIAAPGSRGGKDFWIEFGRMEQALGHRGVCVFEMDPEHRLGIDALRFTSSRWSIGELCQTIARASNLRLSNQQIESSILSHWHSFSSLVHEHGLKEDEQDDYSRFSLLGSPKSDSAGQTLQHVIEQEDEIAAMMEAASLWSLGIAQPNNRSHRYFSLEIHLSSTHNRRPVEAALNSILQEYGLEAVFSLPPVFGSIFQKFWIKTKRRIGTEETKKLLGALEYGITQATLEKNQAENTLMMAEAFSKIVSCLDKETDAIIRLGSIEVVKQDGKLSAVSLTADQMMNRAQPTALAGVVGSMVRAIESDEGLDSEPSTLALGPAKEPDEVD